MFNLYLDANAHLPMTRAALESFTKVNNGSMGHGHPMSPSVTGRAAASGIEEARGTIARYLGCKSNQIIFTSTCSQACEWGIKIASKLANKFFVSKAEHPAVKQSVSRYIDNYESMKIDSHGLCKIDQDLGADTGVVCIHVQNETGIIQDAPTKFSENLLFSDMCQTPGKLPIDLGQLDVDIAPFAAHKFGGPASVGFLYLKNIEWWEEFGAGSRYFTDRAGTPDVSSVVATATALGEAVTTLQERTERGKSFQKFLEDGLEDMGLEIVSKDAPRVWNTTFVYMPDGAGIKTMLSLGEKGIHVGLGSACGSAYTGASPLMQSMNRPGGPHDYMRISQFGEYDIIEAKHFLKVFKECYKQQ